MFKLKANFFAFLILLIPSLSKAKPNDHFKEIDPVKFEKDALNAGETITSMR